MKRFFSLMLAAMLPVLGFGAGSITTDENHNGNRVFNVAVPSAGDDVIDLNYFNGHVTSFTVSAPLVFTGGVISINLAGTSTNGYLSSTDWNTFNNKQPAGSYESPLTFNAPLSRTANSVSIPVASGSGNGYLSSADWTTFNSKQSPLTFGNLTDLGTDGIAVTGGTGSVIGAGVSLAQHVADASHNGYLSLADWTTFNSKQSTLTLGNLTDTGTDGITVTGGTGAVIGGGTSLSQHVADTTHSGYLSSADWNSFHGAVVGAGVSSWNSRTGAVLPLANDYSDAQISFTDILTNNVSITAHGYQPKLPNDSTLFMNGLGQYVALPSTSIANTQLLSGGGVAWTGGLNFTISAATYDINGVQFSSAQTNVTLATADPAFDRIDAFAVNTSGNAVVITGTPGAPPAAPNIDPTSQLYLTFAYVAATAGSPSNAVNENIYLENAEYTSSTNSSGTITLASTNNPFAGTKDIEGTNAANGNFFTLVKPSGNLNLASYTGIVFQLRSKAAWPNQKAIAVSWLNGTTNVGTAVSVKTGVLGFNSSNTTTYQQIVIPASSFGTGSTTVDRVRFSVAGGGANIGWYVDNIILQAINNGGGGGGGSGAGDTSSNITSSVNGQAAIFSGVTGKLITNYLGTGLVKAATGVLSSAVGGTDYENPLTFSAPLSRTTNTVSITGSALTKVNDTNVTLTLGGAPATSLLAAASITAGWTGTLAPARGGLGLDASGITDGQIPIGQTSDHTFGLATITAGTNISVTNAGHSITIANTAPAATLTHTVTFTVDGAGSVLTSGTSAYVKIPYGGTLQGWTLIASPASSSVTCDVLRSADGGGLPVTSIIGGSGTKPALSSAVENSSTSFTSWTSTTLTAKDNMAVSLSGITAATYVCLTLYYQ